jgi:hypothetical protein
VKTATIGGRQFRLAAVERDGRWTAHAERVDTGDRYGIECGGGTEAEAIARLSGWLEWQSEHTAALEALQRAEQASHRTIGSAFASPIEGPSSVELQAEALAAVETARTRLDDVRSRKPE